MIKTIALFIFLCLPFTVLSFIDRTDLLATLNYARTDPVGFASVIESKYLTFKRFKWLANGKTWLTSDGVNAVKEAIALLKAATPVKALQSDRGLDVTAQVQANFLKAQTTLPTNPYLGCKGNDLGTRISEIGRWTSVAESVIGRLDNAEDVIVQLLVSDGDARRGHRLNLLNPTYTQVGFGFSNHDSVSNIMVINYAQEFVCNQGVCPNIPTPDIPHDCKGPGYAYSGQEILKSSILLITLSVTFYLL